MATAARGGWRRAVDRAARRCDCWRRSATPALALETPALVRFDADAQLVAIGVLLEHELAVGADVVHGLLSGYVLLDEGDAPLSMSADLGACAGDDCGCAGRGGVAVARPAGRTGAPGRGAIRAGA